MHTRQLSRGVLWLTDNSPTTQPRRVVDNRQLAAPHAAVKEYRIASSRFTIAFVLVSDFLAAE